MISITHFKYIIIFISLFFISGCAGLFVKGPVLKEHIKINFENYKFDPPEYINKELKDIGEINSIINKKPTKIYLVKLENGTYKITENKKQFNLMAFTFTNTTLLSRIIAQRRYYYDLLNVYATDRILINKQANYINNQCRNEVHYKNVQLKLNDLYTDEIKVQLYNSKEFIRYYRDMEKIDRFFAPFKIGAMIGLGLYGIIQ